MPTDVEIMLSDPVELLPDTDATRSLMRRRAEEKERLRLEEEERVAKTEKV